MWPIPVLGLHHRTSPFVTTVNSTPVPLEVSTT
jgi:hypothetical protein